MTESHSTTETERFWIRVHKTASCWLWTRAKSAIGYGVLGRNNRLFLAHRIAWTLSVGEVPPGLCVLHKCDNPSCVRPDHLFLGTMADNTQDMMKKGRHRADKGSACHNAKLNEADVKTIRAAYAAALPLRKGPNGWVLPGQMSQPVLARQYGVGNDVICRIINRKGWKHVN